MSSGAKTKNRFAIPDALPMNNAQRLSQAAAAAMTISLHRADSQRST